MDLVAEMLLENLRCHHCEEIEAVAVRPPFIRRLSRVSKAGQFAANADRLLNRMFDYPRHLRRIRGAFDLFHVIDHSYSQLVHELPPSRALVSCNDLDTFRCLLPRSSERRSLVFRRMTKRILAGLQRAGKVSCISSATRDEVLRHRLLPPERVVTIPLGVAPWFFTCQEPHAEREADRLLGERYAGSLDVLNVGSVIGRKRVDLVLRIFAAVRASYQKARLVRVGGPLTATQNELARSLGIRDSIVELPFMDDRTLAAVYRRADLLICPSDAEGFGLPMLESMACGTPVAASDIAALREVGGEAATYAPAGDLDQWTDTVLGLLDEKRTDGARWNVRREAGIERAKRFSWRKNAAQTAALYREMLA